MVGIGRKNNTNTFNKFVATTNETASLKWTVKGPSTKLNYIHQTITIDADTKHINLKTYQKPVSLYLYTPHTKYTYRGNLKLHI